MSKINSKFALDLFTASIVLLLICSFSFEFLFKLTPCVLCQLQRIILCSMLVVVLLSRFLTDAYFWFCYLSFVCLNICGLALSGRHIWLQSQPVLDSSPIQCLPSLEILWNWMPVGKFFTTIVHGDALCQAITWSFLGLSLAMWLGMIYLLVFVCWLYFGYKRLLKVS